MWRLTAAIAATVIASGAPSAGHREQFHFDVRMRRHFGVAGRRFHRHFRLHDNALQRLRVTRTAAMLRLLTQRRRRTAPTRRLLGDRCETGIGLWRRHRYPRLFWTGRTTFYRYWLGHAPKISNKKKNNFLFFFNFDLNLNLPRSLLAQLRTGRGNAILMLQRHEFGAAAALQQHQRKEDERIGERDEVVGGEQER